MLRSRTTMLGLVTAVCLSLAAPVANADTTTPPPDPISGTLAGIASTLTDTLQQAEAALTTVQQVFDGVATGHAADATMALRDLSQTYLALPPHQQRAAERYLTRPDGTGSFGNGCDYDAACYSTSNVHRSCSSHICVHWVAKSDDSANGVPTEDDGAGGTYKVGTASGNGIPDAVEFALKQLDHINATYVGAGYRQTKNDNGTGGDTKFDAYLADVGGDGIYGYTTTDDPRTLNDAGGDRHIGVSAYLVLDNDFSHAQFPHHTAAQNLEVTAAHEYFHAVQYGYDYDEDAWMMEGTAVWAEDELYTSINDNRSYLRYGPLHRPSNPLDAFQGLNEYGAWSFFRYLTEHFRKSQGGLPILVRSIWTRAASSGPGAQGLYSLKAIDSALRHTEGTTLAKQFTKYVLANRFPAANYSEGASYPAAQLYATLRPSAGRPGRSSSFKLHRLAAKHLRYVPGTGLRRTSKLRIQLSGASLKTGGAVVVRYKPKGKPMKRARFRLNSAGDGTHTLPFGRGAVAWLEVTVLNTSMRYTCNTYGSNTRWWEHTCQGTPRDNGNATTLAVRALR